VSKDPMLAAAFKIFGQVVPELVDPSSEPEGAFCATSLLGTAFHEAGHAVAHTRLGIPFWEVSIFPDPSWGTLGHVSGPPRWMERPARLDGTRFNRRLPFRELPLRPKATAPRPSAGQIAAEREALVRLAGGWAERLVRTGRRFRGSEWDRSHALRVLARECLTVPEARQYLRRLDRRTAAFVRVNERVIRSVAFELLDRRLMSSRSVTRVVAWETPCAGRPSEVWEHLEHGAARGPGERATDGNTGLRDRQRGRNRAGVGGSWGPGGVSRPHADLAPAVDPEGRPQ